MFWEFLEVGATFAVLRNTCMNLQRLLSSAHQGNEGPVAGGGMLLSSTLSVLLPASLVCIHHHGPQVKF